MVMTRAEGEGDHQVQKSMMMMRLGCSTVQPMSKCNILILCRVFIPCTRPAARVDAAACSWLLGGISAASASAAAAAATAAAQNTMWGEGYR